MSKSRFDAFWETIEGNFPSESSRYFAKPLIRSAFNAGLKLNPKANKISADDIVVSGRTGASDAEG